MSDINPIPEKFDIVYARQIDYNRIPHNFEYDDTLSLSSEPHPMIVLDVLTKNHLLVGVFGTTVDTKNNHYIFEPNDIIIKKSSTNGLTSPETLFRFHASNINMLKYTTLNFERKTVNDTGPSYKLGEINEKEKEEIKTKFESISQIQAIITAVKKSKKQILERKHHSNKDYKLTFTKLIKKYNKNKKKR